MAGEGFWEGACLKGQPLEVITLQCLLTSLQEHPPEGGYLQGPRGLSWHGDQGAWGFGEGPKQVLALSPNSGAREGMRLSCPLLCG